MRGPSRQLDPRRHQVITHLWLKCIAKAPEQLAEHLEQLSESETLLSCGYNGAEYYAFAEAARALIVSGVCPPEHVEALFLDAKPEHQRAVRYLDMSRKGEENGAGLRRWAVETLQESGKTVWGILTVVGRDHLSERGQATYDQLQRKFAHLPVQEPRISRVRQVVSPLSKDAATAMTDTQWLSAIQKYDSDHRRGKETEQTVEGGARSLAHMLFEIAKTDAIRFLRFALQIPEDAYPSYLTSGIEGVSHAEEIDTVQAIPLILELHETRRDACGQQLCELVSRQPELAHDEAILQMCLWYAVHRDGPELGEKDLEQARESVVKLDQFVNSGMGIIVSGDVYTKTCAWAALTQALWLESPRLNVTWPVFFKRRRHRAIFGGAHA